MKIDFDQKLKTLDGKDLKIANTEETVDLKTICIQALVNATEGQQPLSADDKIKYYNLALKIFQGGKIDLEVNDIATIKKLIGESRAMNIIVVGQSYLMLEGK